MKLSASFLSVHDRVKENVRRLDSASIDYLHLDVMDGVFVASKSYTITEMRELIEGHQKPLDVHLMVSDVKPYIDQYKELNPAFVTVHYEALQDEMSVISYIHDMGMKAGISINPSTKVEEIVHLLPFVDLVLVMGVEPGKGGQAFLESAVSKVDQLQKLRNVHDYEYLIEVDGGINEETIQLVGNADICVVGSYVTKEENYEEQLQKLRDRI